MALWSSNLSDFSVSYSKVICPITINESTENFWLKLFRPVFRLNSVFVILLGLWSEFLVLDIFVHSKVIKIFANTTFSFKSGFGKVPPRIIFSLSVWNLHQPNFFCYFQSNRYYIWSHRYSCESFESMNAISFFAPFCLLRGTQIPQIKFVFSATGFVMSVPRFCNCKISRQSIYQFHSVKFSLGWAPRTNGKCCLPAFHFVNVNLMFWF